MKTVLETGELWKAICHHSHRFVDTNSRKENGDASRSSPTREENQGHVSYTWEVESKDLVVVPSLSFSTKELRMVEGILHYEERALFVLFALSEPQTRLVIVTTMPLDEWILKYYFSLLPLHHREMYKSRVHFYSVGDPNPERSLTEKIMARPRLLDRLKRGEEDMVPNKQKQQRVMMVYQATSHEQGLAELLDMPCYAAKPEQGVYGTKQGSRTVFRSLGILCADGTYAAETDLKRFQRAIWKVLRRNPDATKGVVKLAEGFSGIGNAIIDLRDIQARLNQVKENEEDADHILARVTLHAFESMVFHYRNWDDFAEELQTMGAIFELFIDYPKDCRMEINRAITSPSVQVVVNEDGSVSVLSTHEQILEDQVYHGCEFPCRSDYRMQLMEYGRKIGVYLSEQGVQDHFGVDFMCVPNVGGSWDVYGVEINLRFTGTAHPFMTMKLLTHGHTNPNTGLFLIPSGREKYYVSSDHVSDLSLKRLVPQDLYELMMARSDLHWDPTRQTGAIFHMLGRMPECGTLSMTAIADSLEEAHELFDETYNYVIAEAQRDPTK